MSDSTKLTSLFQGDVTENISLIDIFQTLSNRQRQGWLIYTLPQSVNSEKRLYFERNEMGLVTISNTSIPEKLYHAKKISTDQYNKSKELLYPETLVYLKEILPEDTQKIMETTCYDEICRILAYREGHFEFIGYDPTYRSSLGIPKWKLFDIGSILMEAARRGDEWRQIYDILPDEEEVLIQNVVEIPESIKENQNWVYLWELANKVTIKEILLYSSLSDFESAKLLSSWFANQYLRLITDGELLAHIEQLQLQHLYKEALELSKVLWKRIPNELQLWDFLFTTYKKSREKSFLLSIYEHLDKIILPENTEELVHKIQCFKRICDALIKEDLIREAKTILQKIPVIKITDVELQKDLLNLYLKFKDFDNVVAIYEKIACSFEERGEITKALSTYQKIVEIVPSRQDILKKLDILKTKKLDSSKPLQKISKRYIVYAILGIFILFLIQRWIFTGTSSRSGQSQIENIHLKLKEHNWVRARELTKLLPKPQQPEIFRLISNQQMAYEKQIHKIKALISQAQDKEKEGDLYEALKLLKEAERINVTSDVKNNIQSINNKIEKFQEQLLETRKLEKENKRDESVIKSLILWNDRRYNKMEDRFQIRLPIWVKVKTLGTDLTVYLPKDCYFFSRECQNDFRDKNIPNVRNSFFNRGFLISQNISIESQNNGWLLYDNETQYCYSVIIKHDNLMIENFVVKLNKEEMVIHCPPDFEMLKVFLEGYKTGYYYNDFHQSTGEIKLNSEAKKLLPLSNSNLNIYLPKDITWSYPLGTGTTSHDTLYFAENTLYVPCNEGYICAFANLDSKIPRFKWKSKKICNTGFIGSPCYWNGFLSILGKDQRLYTIDTQTVQRVNCFNLTNVRASPVIFPKHDLIICPTENEIYAFPLTGTNKSNWAYLWKFSTPLPVICYSIFLDNQMIVITQDGLVSILDTGGRIVRKYQIGFPITNYSLIVNNEVLYGGNSEELFAFHMDTQVDLWRGQIAGAPLKNLSLYGKKLYCVTNNRINVFSAENGKILWSFTEPNEIFITLPFVDQNGVIYIGSRHLKTGYQNVYAIDNNKILWEYQIGRVNISSPIKIGNRIIVASDELYTFLDN